MDGAKNRISLALRERVVKGCREGGYSRRRHQRPQPQFGVAISIRLINWGVRQLPAKTQRASNRPKSAAIVRKIAGPSSRLAAATGAGIARFTLRGLWRNAPSGPESRL